MPPGTPERTLWLVASAIGMPTALVVARSYGRRRAVRYLAGYTAAAAVQYAFLSAMRRRIGPEPSSPADLLTTGRGLCGAVLAGLVVTDIRDRTGPAGWLGLVAIVWGATASDWLDGPLARRFGVTRLGAALDIEADSWLTLWAATGAVRWGGLPPWSLLPPLLRYIHPSLDLLVGGMPTGGGPWWGRATGTAQMALFVAALVPRRARPRDGALTRVAVLVAAGQATTVFLLLRRRGLRS